MKPIYPDVANAWVASSTWCNMCIHMECVQKAAAVGSPDRRLMMAIGFE